MDDEAQFGGSSSSYPTKDPNPFEAYDLMLRESNQHFFSELRKDRPNFRVLTSVFARLLQTMPDPPVEIIWFYSAVALRCQQQDHHHHLAAASVMDLFQLLVSCSVSCGAAKRVAVLAPLIFKLFQFLTRFQAMMMSSREEIDRLVEGVVSYINTCCVGDAISGDDRSDGGSTSDHLRLQCFVDSVRVWTVDLWQDPESWDFGEALELFFPLLSSRVYQGLGGGGGFGVGYLAGVVMTQALLLRLCYKCVSNSGGQSSRVELHNDMLSWTVGSVNGFLNWYFFDVFFSILLDPILPVTSLLSLEDEIFMRQVLYDAVVMVKYSFLNLESGIQLYSDNSKNLAIMWLLVAEDAMQFIRKHGDQAKAISYSEAFTKCHLCSQLVDWISSHTTVIRKNGRPVFSTPSGLIGWLLVLEYRGHIFFDKISKVNSRALECKLKSSLGISFVMPDCWSVDESLMCCIENGRREEAEVDMDSSEEAMFLATSRAKSSSLTGGRRKREEGIRIEGEARAKNFRYGIDRTPTGEMHLSSSREDRVRSGSEAGNFVFDECVDDMEL